MVKPENMVRYCKVYIQDVLPLIGSTLLKAKVTIAGYPVNAHSVRLRAFKKKGTKCIACGINASYFVIEREKGNPHPHLNLYALKGTREILFTHDHTKARCFGGTNDMNNVEPMCSPCNAKKARVEEKLLLSLVKEGKDVYSAI